MASQPAQRIQAGRIDVHAFVDQAITKMKIHHLANHHVVRYAPDGLLKMFNDESKFLAEAARLANYQPE